MAAPVEPWRVVTAASRRANHRAGALAWTSGRNPVSHGWRLARSTSPSPRRGEGTTHAPDRHSSPGRSWSDAPRSLTSRCAGFPPSRGGPSCTPRSYVYLPSRSHAGGHPL